MGRVSCSPPWPDSNHWDTEGEKEEEGSKLKTYSLLKCFTLHTTLGVEAEKPLTVSKPHGVVGEVPSEGHCFVPRAEGGELAAAAHTVS